MTRLSLSRSIPKNQISNQNGQAIVAALVILPLALAISFSLAIAGYAIALEAKATAACRASLIESQREAARALEKLLALNRQAEIAEASYKSAKILRIASRSSLIPATVLAGEIAYWSARAYRESIAGQQKLWLTKGKLASRMAPENAARAIQATLPTTFTKDLGSRDSKLEFGRFHLIASPPNARTPTYRTAPGFSLSQETSAHWLLSIRVPGIALVPRVELGCAATLKKNGGHGWAPQITEDKLLSN